jgi:hypothetical protein
VCFRSWCHSYLQSALRPLVANLALADLVREAARLHAPLFSRLSRLSRVSRPICAIC